MTTNSWIFELVAQHGCLPMLPGPWARFLCAHGFLGRIAVAAQLLDKLKIRFSVEDLTASGVVVLDQAGELRLHPSLADRHAICFLARRAETAPPWDWVTDEGQPAGEPSVLRMFSDYRTQQALQHNGHELLVSFSL